jgi:hypothetical protein
VAHFQIGGDANEEEIAGVAILEDSPKLGQIGSKHRTDIPTGGKDKVHGYHFAARLR